MKTLQDPLFQALFNAPVPRIIVQANAPLFTIVISNDAHKVVTNLVGKDISGKSVWETFNPAEAGGDGGKLLSDALTEAQLTNSTILMPPFRYDMGTIDGSGMVEKWWQLEIMPIGSEPTTPAFLLVTTNEISEQVFRERDTEVAKAALMEINLSLEEQVAFRTKELQTAYEQVALSKQAAQLGTFDMDLINGTMEWDRRCRELFGVSHDDQVTYEHDFLTGLHPDDRERVGKLIERLFDPTQSDGDYDVEYRTIGVADGRLRWVRAKGKVYFNDSGKAHRFIGSVLDVTDKKNEEQLRNSFISMASHELKTPLTSLRGYLQILKAKMDANSDGFIRQALQNSERQIIKMGGIINGFLTMSRLESGKLHLNLQPTELGQLIEQTINEFRLLNPGVAICFERGVLVHLHLDQEKIEHVLINLLSNAVKYSKKGMPVTVGYTTNDSQVTVSVEDTGVGISESDIAEIFEPFYRSASIKDQHISGFGIGLYLCKEIVTMHQGEISVSSALGQGSTFYFNLPLMQRNVLLAKGS
jgi:PAS domain S-box-containing protein